MNTETKIKKLWSELLATNFVMLLFALVVLFCALRNSQATTKLTDAVSTLSQKANVEFNVKTNHVLGVWTKLRPM